MTPDQAQQLMNQWAQTAISGMPLWEKAILTAQILSYFVIVICLPLITWKLYFGNKSVPASSLSPAEQARLQQIRERRGVSQKLTGSGQSENNPEKANDDSRFQPPK